jgi:hypothetical protein
MTRDQHSDLQIGSPEEFELLLAAIVEEATESGVDVRGAWEFRTDGSTHEWEVEIVELARELEEKPVAEEDED